jgi:hypothetical protein
MKEIKKLGIWMCNSSIHLVEYTDQFAEDLQKPQSEESQIIETDNAILQNEALHLQTESFKKLGTAIEHYEEVILFGPVDAKLEFMKFLKADKRFNNIKIDVKQTTIMSETQQQKYVEKYFSNRLHNLIRNDSKINPSP